MTPPAAPASTSAASSASAPGSELRKRVTGAPQPADNLFGPSSPSLFAASSASGPHTMVMTREVYDRIQAEAQEKANAAADKKIRKAKADSDKQLKEAKNELHCGDCFCGCCLGLIVGAAMAGSSAAQSNYR